MIIKASYITNYGNFRIKNEDSLLVQDEIVYEKNMEEPENKILESKKVILCVADGMGGHLGGELASRSVLSFVRDNFMKIYNARTIKKILLKSKNILNTIASETRSYGLGTTGCGMRLKDKKGIIFNCGDSRVYRVQKMYLERLTIDHSVVQAMYNSGLIDEEEMRTHPNKNLLTSAIIGDYSQNHPVIAMKEIAIKEGDQFFICTDGLWESMSVEELTELFFSCENQDERALKLNQLSLHNGGKDNITMILFEILEL